MHRRIETLLNPTARPGTNEPPAGLIAFYWHFAGQAKGLFGALMLFSLLMAVTEALIPVFLGRLVTMLTTLPRERFFDEAWPLLAGMGFIVLIARPLIVHINNTIEDVAIIPPVTNLIRWQSHWHVLRQTLPFFQNDYAGRIAARVMETGFALRETVAAAIRAVWYILVYGIVAMGLLLAQDWRLAVPVALWFAAYGALLVFYVPRVGRASKETSEARSIVTGRVVDSYTNAQTVKLFARHEHEDAYVREAIDAHTGRFQQQMRIARSFFDLLAVINAAMLVSVAVLALMAWRQGTIEVGVVAMALPLAWQITNVAGWVAMEVRGIFENVGIVQEGMETIAQPIGMRDAPGAVSLKVREGAIHFDQVRFAYGQSRSVIEAVDLQIRPGEKVGLVGRSGAGKSTLVNLLLRFYDVEAGRVLIDGQDIRGVTQDSLRAAISVVTQDTSLLHRSIRDNIRYGRPEAGEAEVAAAAERAHAAEFIPHLTDWAGRRGYEAQVGERGVKLSGGQRQRIAIARVILKNAPILVLDEATSALDSEVEAAIQDSLVDLMAGKTVIAIAHRLSTLQIMDRLVVLDQGRIVEQGSHAELLGRKGLYAELWARQSGGFIDAGSAPQARAAE